MNRFVFLKTSLILIGGLLGPLNLVLFYILGSKLNDIPFYQRLTNAEILKLYGGFWYFILFVPCVISTTMTLHVLWDQLLKAKTRREHVIWGMSFGVLATICTTGLLIASGSVFNYLHGTSSEASAVLGLGLAIPGALVLGTVFVILFSPAILIAGPLFGVIAMALKQKLVYASHPP